MNRIISDDKSCVVGRHMLNPHGPDGQDWMSVCPRPGTYLLTYPGHPVARWICTPHFMALDGVGLLEEETT